MTKRKIQYWVIPPEADPEFIASMEEIPRHLRRILRRGTIRCFAWMSNRFNFTRRTRKPIAATKNHPRRVDYEYERCGTACVFMFTEPLSGWRQATARPQRTKVDWALEMAAMLDSRYKKARKVILVCDNLNTHTKGAFYEAFPPAKARAYVKRIDFRYTPKHGSWLNIAENELSSMTRQCVLWPSLRDNQETASRNQTLVRPFQQQATRR